MKDMTIRKIGALAIPLLAASAAFQAAAISRMEYPDADTLVVDDITRMEYAAELIKKYPEFTLGAIAEACGIKSPATFIRNFKATYDMTPSEYRQQLEESSTPPHRLISDSEEDAFDDNL